MKLHTASSVISFARELENSSAQFYEDLAQRYTKDKDALLSFTKENKKNIIEFERAYYGVITDALEGCFAFEIEPDEYAFECTLGEKITYPEALEKAIGMEEKMVKFYSDAAEQSRSLMADVPRVFAIIAKKRRNREPKLRLLLSEEG